MIQGHSKKELELPPTETQSRTFKSWGGNVIGQLCLLIGLTHSKNKLCPLFMTESSFRIWRKGSVKLGSGAPTGTERHRVLSSLITFQRDGSKVFEKDIPGCKIGRGLLKRFTPQRIRERLYKFSNENALRKGEVRSQNQEEVHLKLSQDDRNVKAILAN